MSTTVQIRSTQEKTDDIQTMIALRKGITESKATELIDCKYQEFKRHQISFIEEDKLRFFAARHVFIDYEKDLRNNE